MWGRLGDIFHDDAILKLHICFDPAMLFPEIQFRAMSAQELNDTMTKGFILVLLP